MAERGIPATDFDATFAHCARHQCFIGISSAVHQVLILSQTTDLDDFLACRGTAALHDEPRKDHRMTRLFFALIAATVALPAVPASAKDHSWPIGNDGYHVYYRDLDMNNLAGRAEMLKRVEKAARKLCSPRFSLQIDLNACVAEVVAKSAPRSPMLRLALSERGSNHLASR